MQILSVVKCRLLAVAARQMIIKKALDQLFIDAFDINIALGNPVSKVGQSGKIIINGV
jgi:hypothetical protein